MEKQRKTVMSFKQKWPKPREGVELASTLLFTDNPSPKYVLC